MYLIINGWNWVVQERCDMRVAGWRSSINAVVMEGLSIRTICWESLLCVRRCRYVILLSSNIC